ncbi:MAG: type II toxin-antitoxin system HicA family toxin [Holophagales bacterium]|nr:MAG: type II toxin-antitoxin system HicA family toxin [Holophagales bacterium]
MLRGRGRRGLESRLCRRSARLGSGVSRLPAVTGKQRISALERAGFVDLRVKGSHHFLRHEDGRTTVVAAHAGEALGPGLLSKILRDCKLTRDGLADLVR